MRPRNILAINDEVGIGLLVRRKLSSQSTRKLSNPKKQQDKGFSAWVPLSGPGCRERVAGAGQLRRHEEAVSAPWGVCKSPWRSNGVDVRDHEVTGKRSWEG